MYWAGGYMYWAEGGGLAYGAIFIFVFIENGAEVGPICGALINMWGGVGSAGASRLGGGYMYMGPVAGGYV